MEETLLVFEKLGLEIGFCGNFRFLFDSSSGIFRRNTILNDMGLFLLLRFASLGYRSLVRYPEHYATAAMVGHGAGVLDERVELEGIPRLLELDILAFFGVQQFGYSHLSSVDGLSSFAYTSIR